MAQFHELETKEEVPGYFGEVFNPFGYYNFIVDPNRDWAEKAEHAGVAAFIFNAPLHIGAAMSTGGYWANLPPGIHARAASAMKWKHDLVVGAAKHAYRGARAISPGVWAGAFAAGLWYSTQEILQYLNPDMPDFGDMRIRYR